MQRKTIIMPHLVLTTLEKTQHYDRETTQNLLVMYEGIADAKKTDDATTNGQAKPYRVMQNPDFQEQACAIEEVLAKRGVKYTKLVWP